VSVALTTGLIFVRFAKPTARILFSQNAVVRNIDGRRMLMLRMANERYNRIVDASAKASVARIETLADGESFYRIHDLKLVRDHTQVFNLTWTLMHEIDESSPLDQLDPDQLAAARMRIVVSVTGHDETVAATVYAVHTYTSTDLAIDARFSDVLSIDAEGGRVVDLTRFHDIEPLSGA
jgi:inward rectifier potassium channel